MTEFFGIKHFSPLCGYHVTEFLRRTEPELVLIEAPRELSALLPLLRDDGGVRLPVSLLICTDDPPLRILSYPLTEWSPEFNAMKWAWENGVPVELCDIPCGAAMYHALNNKSKETDGYEAEEPVAADYDEYAAAVRDKGSALRKACPPGEYGLLREAFMRRAVAEAEAEHGRVAAVIGALHLEGVEGVPYTERDRLMTEDAPSVPVRLTLAPDSYARISTLTGYGSGAASPAESEVIFKRLCGETSEPSDGKGSLPPNIICTSVCEDLRYRLEKLRLGELIKRGSMSIALDINKYNITDTLRSELLHGLLAAGVDIGSFSQDEEGGREVWRLRMPTDGELQVLTRYGWTISRALKNIGQK